jgi:hypothetical protein
MRVLLANDRTQTEPKIRLLAGTDKSPTVERESPGLGTTGALKDEKIGQGAGGLYFLPSELTTPKL